jgi:hypothetical protein
MQAIFIVPRLLLMREERAGERGAAANQLGERTDGGVASVVWP